MRTSSYVNECLFPDIIKRLDEDKYVGGINWKKLSVVSITMLQHQCTVGLIIIKKGNVKT